MCCSCEEKKLGCYGIIFSLGFLVAAIVCIILAGVNFNITNINFTNGSWKSLAGLELACIIFVISVCVFGILAFWCKHWFLTTIVSILL